MTVRTPLARRPPGASLLRSAWFLPLLALAALLPFLIENNFIIGVFTDCLIYCALALAYDLSVGRVGTLSLALPLFFGTGSYAAALLAAHFGVPFPVAVLFAVACAAILAVAIGIPALRLSHLTFGMATLGFALIGELIANNWTQVTGGPDCVGNVSQMALPSGFTLGLSEQGQEYYIFLGLAVAVGVAIRLLVSSRIGRAFVAVREDEPMAMSVGMNPRRYRLAAFVTSGAIAGLVGAFYAHYLTVVCPTNLDISYTVNLLVILFLGGTGGFWGIIAAAFVVTAIPELLQVAPNVRLIAYGLVLLIGVGLMPSGAEGVVRRLVQMWRFRRTQHDA